MLDDIAAERISFESFTVLLKYTYLITGIATHPHTLRSYRHFIVYLIFFFWIVSIGEVKLESLNETRHDEAPAIMGHAEAAVLAGEDRDSGYQAADNPAERSVLRVLPVCVMLFTPDVCELHFFFFFTLRKRSCRGLFIERERSESLLESSTRFFVMESSRVCVITCYAAAAVLCLKYFRSLKIYAWNLINRRINSRYFPYREIVRQGRKNALRSILSSA